ncbi:MAG TPA: DUF362 domain-containing protein [candidate division Zixibacteria bacterium]|nr:DUF362 domain-containing protein [candidate division Zixibacteria bacterium]
MDRRVFCQKVAIVGGSIAIAPIIKACSPIRTSPPQDSVPPTKFAKSKPDSSPVAADMAPATSTLTSEAGPTAVILDDPGFTKIALVRTRDRSQGVREALRLLEYGGIKGDNVLLKPNFNSADESPGSTHIDTLRALIGELQENGAGTITVGDRSGMGHTRSVMQQKGIDTLAADLGLTLVAFDELEDEEWTVIRSNDHHWQDGFAVPRILLDAHRVVQTCNLKTHRYGGHFTMALKNSVGLAAKRTANRDHDYMSELHNSVHQRKMIAEINTAYKPDLIVMDGIEAFVTGGPDNGRRVSPEVIVAGKDPIAVDAVGVAILRYFGTTPEVSKGSVFDQEQIARAVELGVGISSPDLIQILTSGEGSLEFADQLNSILLS